MSSSPTSAPPQVLQSEGLHAVLRHLRDAHYNFTTPTPVTHRRVISRRRVARDLRDVFGWSLPFCEGLLPPALLCALREAGALKPAGDGRLHASVRVSSLGQELFLHSAFPTDAEDAVFFGPDTYRFARFLKAHADGREIRLAVEVGVGSGAGSAVLAKAHRPQRLVATDVNPRALQLAGINLAEAKLDVQLRLADGLEGIAEPADLIIANPPYIADRGERTYRDGGDLHGARLSLEWALSGAARLAPGGRLLLYTGSAIVDGRDRLREALAHGLGERFALDYSEIDPDVFSEQLDEPAYCDVERIAVIGAVIHRRA